MTEHVDWDRLARYVSGESGATERADIERWAATSESNRAILESARRRWNAASDGASWNVDGAWTRLSARLEDVTVDSGIVDIDTRRARPLGWPRVTRIVSLAAAAVLLIAVTLQLRRDEPGTEGATMALSIDEMRTGVGEQRTIDLTDGSQVVLGAASTLRLAPGFGTTTREVSLEGQAFLRVKHDAARPFIVNAGGTRTVDLGTAFEVRAYPNETVRVAVTEGVVAVARDTGVADSTVLQPGDVAEVPTTGETVVKRQQNVERLLGWTRGELVFDDTPLSEVARELERWFDVQVRIEEDALRSRRFSVPLKIGESLDNVLELIETAVGGIRAERNGNVITIRSGQRVNPTSVPVPTRRVEAGA
jgi:ferric-dicitrate binding protein FerR (iron transport regulator)